MQELTTVKTPSLRIAITEVFLTSPSSLSQPPSSTSSPLSALIGGSSFQPLKSRRQVLCVKQSWTAEPNCQMSMWRRRGGGCESSWAYLSLHNSHPAISSSRARVATVTTCSSPVWLAGELTNRPANLISQMFPNLVHSTSL